MPRLAPYLGIAAALSIGIFVVVISGVVTRIQTRAPADVNASSTVSVSPNAVLPPITPLSLEPEAVKTAASVQGQSTTVVSSPAKEVVASVPSLSPSERAALLNASASLLRSALVNILCYAPAGGRLRSISGSGIIIASKGVILTNAHIAQNFLLKNRGVSCVIRAGSPAVDAYEASLIYIPSAWVKENADILTEVNPIGTGEYDFAFLAVSRSSGRKELSASFPSLPLASSPPVIGAPVVIASYAAQFLESSQIQSSLFPTIVFGSVKNIFTFASTSIDVLALGGSAAAQEGSSGGGVSDMKGELVGTITTSTIKGATETRSLDAITASYIRAAYLRETGEPLDTLLSKSTSEAIADFAPQIPAMESALTAYL